MSSQSYIVRLKNSATEQDLKEATELFKSHGGQISHEHTLFKGFSGSLPADKIAALEALPHVDAIEKDGEVRIQ